MPRLKSKTEKTRISMEWAPAERDRCLEIQETTGAGSMTEVIRRALAVYGVLVNACESGRDVVLRSSDGEPDERLVIL